MSRLPPLDPEALSPAQSEVYNRIATGARGGVRGPFLALLHSPALASKVEGLGVYLRFQCAVRERLREVAILTVARHWRCDYEWYAHAPIAERMGVPEAALARLGRGEDAGFEEPDETLVQEYCATLLRDGAVPQPLYDRVRERLGQQGIVDLTGLVGYYTLLALTLNAHVIHVPEGADIPWRAA
ncbi:carboxymuconolactone decarboxylase family protein [Roseomonas chloroacetimidivorans]|jgi:4-carboxymuconolactone decarboxylase|uniref:carboxymuconolactone decarboxylase family protein n=1 Tax=Roseomonas chloroacetimidivorans TaxID=1766656 RepID=UPI003C71F926